MQVRRRIEAYNAQTEPVIAYYRGANGRKVFEIDGNGTPDEVAASMASALESLKGER